MSIKITISEKEIEKSVRILQRVATSAGNLAQDELHKSGLNIETGAKEETPVDTGRLRSSIHMESNSINRTFIYSDEGGAVFNGKLGVSPKPLEVYVGTNVHYAEKIHRNGGRNGRGQGFLLKAYEAERPLLIARLRKGIREVARGHR